MCVPHQGCSGTALGFKTKENKMCLRIYGFEGEAGRRGRCGRGPTNQITAGCGGSVPDGAFLGVHTPRPSEFTSMKANAFIPLNSGCG